MSLRTQEDILEYLINKLHLRVFPLHSVDLGGTCTCLDKDKCKTPGKHPFRNFGWKKKATRDLTAINKVTKGKNFNIAVATGDLSEDTNKYLVVIDVDVPVHEIQACLPKTFSYRTGGGGYHYWYWSPVPIRNSASKIADKVDIRGSNGYVIVPPSKHKSGNPYEFIGDGTDEPISDIPQFVLDKVKSSLQETQTKRTTSKKRKQEPQTHNINFRWWTESTVSNIQATIQSGIQIPLGVRNNTLFRLLSSHRAKGIATYEELMTLGIGYKKFLENPETFDNKELRGICCSVMRYPVYNSNAENVNKNYCKWLEKKGIKSDLQMVEQVDDLFFSTLKPGKSFVSLAWVVKHRKAWYSRHGIKDYAVYKSQLMASKLRSLGFSRVRTSKVNLWNVDTSLLDTGKLDTGKLDTGENVLAQHIESCENVNNRRDKMPTKKKSVKSSVSSPDTEGPRTPLKPIFTDPVNPPEAIQNGKTTSGTAEPLGAPDVTQEVHGVQEAHGEENEETASANGPIGPDGNPLTLVEEREDIITTDRKYNPDDFKYNGMQQSSQDLLMAQIKLFEKLSPEQEAEYETGTMIYDEDRTRDFMGAIQKGDIVGIKNTMYRIHSVEDDHLHVSPRGYNKHDRKYHFETPEETLSIFDLDNALTMGFGQILYRNDKPFGLDDEMTYKVLVRVYADSVGRTYVFKSGREVIKHQPPKEKNDTATTRKQESA